MSKPVYPGQKPSRATAQRERDAALTRVSRVRRLVIIGAGALTAAVAVVVSAASGRTLGAKTPVSTRPVVATKTGARSALPRMPPLANPGQLGLRAPSSAPQSAPQTQTQAPTQTQPAPAPQPQQAAPPAVSQPAPVSGGS